MKKSGRGRKLPGEVLSAEEIRALLASFSSTQTGIRDRALVATALYASLRCAEALDLRPADVDLGRCAVTVLSGKGGKRGVAGLNPAAIPHLQAWLEIRPQAPTLFCSLRGKRINNSYFRTMIRRAAAVAGISHRVHPHALRHTAAVNLASRLPVHLVSRQLRHSNLSTTAGYLAHFAANEVVEAVAAVNW